MDDCILKNPPIKKSKISLPNFLNSNLKSNSKLEADARSTMLFILSIVVNKCLIVDNASLNSSKVSGGLLIIEINSLIYDETLFSAISRSESGNPEIDSKFHPKLLKIYFSHYYLMLFFEMALIFPQFF